MELQSIKAELEKLVDPEKILVFEEVGSTMDEVKKFNTSVGELGFKGVVVSLSQTSGRGRQGRIWISNRGDGVYLSAIFKVQFEDQSLFVTLPLLVGIKLKEKLEVVSEEIKLKWPNDIVVKTENGVRKLAGLLLEAGHEGQFSSITIGVGLNLRKIAIENAVSVEELNPKNWSASRAAKTVLESILDAVDAVKTIDRVEFVKEYNANMVYLDEHITLLEREGTSVSGKNRGIDRDGSLLLETPNGILKLYSGDVHQGLNSNE